MSRVPDERIVPDIDVEQLHHIDEFEAAARQVLNSATYAYVAGGAGGESTMRRNLDALAELLFVPRILRGVEQISTSRTVLGLDLAIPLIVAPTAVQRIAHTDGELATARAARDAGLAMILSMNSSVTCEAVAAEGVNFLMQLYVPDDRNHVRGIVERAVAAGAAGVVLTVDQAGLPVRLRELHEPLVVPDDVDFVHLGTTTATRGVAHDLTWADVEWLRSICDVPVVLKGVLHPDDARLAVEHGVDGVILSNHGGRQLESTVSAYDMVESVLEAIDARCTVIVDGGIRAGTDLLKALALGADAAMIGRPVVWGLAAAGEHGVARILELVRRDLDAAMRLCGINDIEHVSSAILRNIRTGTC